MLFLRSPGARASATPLPVFGTVDDESETTRNERSSRSRAHDGTGRMVFGSLVARPLDLSCRAIEWFSRVHPSSRTPVIAICRPFLLGAAGARLVSHYARRFLAGRD